RPPRVAAPLPPSAAEGALPAAPGALLPPRLPAAAAHLAAAACGVRAHAPVGELAHHRLMHHGHVHRASEHRVGELEGAAGLPAAVENGKARHGYFAPFACRCALGSCTLFRTSTPPPRAPSHHTA